jgi:ribosomal-protein-alanine N-acetyltransferase
MGDPVVLVTDRLIVRTATFADAPAMCAFLTRNEEFFAPTAAPAPPGWALPAHWERAFAREAQELAEGRAARFKLFLRDAPGDIVGTAALSEVIRGPFQACPLGYKLDQTLQGRGYMREALEAVLGFAFDTWGLHRVMANHLPTNERSAALLRRLGFVVEGYARDYLFIDGAWRDHVLTARTNPRPSPP